MNEKHLICIVCPIGCHLTIDENLIVTGNKCYRGKTYAIEEMTHPTRILTTTVKTISKHMPRVSVKTHKPLEKALIFDALIEINKIILKKDVKIGDIIISNICNSDVHIVATKNFTL